MSHSLLLIDSDLRSLESTAQWLRTRGFRVDTAGEIAGASKRLARQPPAVVISDLQLCDGDGFDLLQQVHALLPQCPVILLSAQLSVDVTLRAMRAGAQDLLPKPAPDCELLEAIERAVTRPAAEDSHSGIPSASPFEAIVARDPRMREVFELVDRVADSATTVLITGESGTGKSLLARAIHERSSRCEHPFVEVTCGALSETLLESELFGHVAEAFTGATRDKVGRFEQAGKGTVFLDEISTASPRMQVKLLRVLQEFCFEPVGGSCTVEVGARVVLATNEDLAKRVAEGTFREDLFYRINIINLELPPLRERVADIPLLVDHFLDKICAATGRKIRGIGPEAILALQAYPWPGNVRELENVMERAVLLSKGPHIDVGDLPPNVSGTAPRRGPPQTLKEALEIPERRIILASLEEHGWNRHQTAEALGINRTTLYKKMKRLGLEESALQGTGC